MLEFFRRKEKPDSITNVERINPIPFTIRGHHLRRFHELQKMTCGKPKPLGKYMDYERDRWNVFKLIDSDGKTTAKTRVPDYYVDVMGSSPEENERFYEQTAVVYKNFLQLDPTYPVHLTTQPDSICGTCIHGQHCTKSSPQADVNTIEAFIRRIESKPSLKIGKTVITEETIYYGDNSVLVKRVQTTAGTVKNVLNSYRSFDEFASF